MPIRPDLRQFYRGSWAATRMRILDRAGGRCERCFKPDREVIWTRTGKALVDGELVPVMWWAARPWEWHRFGPPNELVHWHGPAREVRVIITVAHLDHTSGNDTEENLRALCQWCHLHYDQLHHHETRAARKDAGRPLLQAAEQ